MAGLSPQSARTIAMRFRNRTDGNIAAPGTSSRLATAMSSRTGLMASGLAPGAASLSTPLAGMIPGECPYCKQNSVQKISRHTPCAVAVPDLVPKRRGNTWRTLTAYVETPGLNVCRLKATAHGVCLQLSATRACRALRWRRISLRCDQEKRPPRISPRTGRKRDAIAQTPRAGSAAGSWLIVLG